MTFQRDQLQALIQRIDDLLNRTDSRSGVRLPEMGAERQVLAQTREYLGRLEQQMAGQQPFPQASDSTPTAQAQSWQAPAPQMAETAQQVLQAIVQEMNFLRTNMMQPLREEVVQLQQERHLLTAEIQQLQQERQQLASSSRINQQKMIQEFLQTLMGRLQEQLAGQVAQAIANIEAQASQSQSLTGAPDAQQISGQSTNQPRLTPAERLEHLQLLQAQSDDLMLRLDSTLRVVFESLQTNIENYQDSLGQGLEKMHGLGQQGETMFTALVNRLANQLGREASYYLKSSPPTEWELPGPSSADQGTNVLLSNPASYRAAAAAQAVRDEIPDHQVNRILGTASPTPPTDASASQPPMNDLLDELDTDLANPDSESEADLDLGLDTLDLDAPSPDLARIDDFAEAADDDALTFLQIDDDQIPLPPENSSTPTAAEADGPPNTDADGLATDDDSSPAAVDAETDEALELLDQMATEMEDQLDESPWDTAEVQSPTFHEEMATAISEVATQQDWDMSGDPLDADPNGDLDGREGDDSEVDVRAEEATDRERQARAADEIDEFYAIFNAATEGEPADPDSEADSIPETEDELVADDLAAGESLSSLFDESADDLPAAPPDQTDWDPIDPTDPIDPIDSIDNSETVETIHRLTDLISDGPSAGDRRSSQVDHGYVQASPDEDLLSAADGILNLSTDFQLDEALVRQLSADLSSLEGLEEMDLTSDHALAEMGEDWDAASATLDTFGDELELDPTSGSATDDMADPPPPAEPPGTNPSVATNGMTLDAFADRIGPPASVLETETDMAVDAASSEEAIESLFAENSHDGDRWPPSAQEESLPPALDMDTAAQPPEDGGIDNLFGSDEVDQFPPAEAATSQPLPASDPASVTHPTALRVEDLFPTPSVPSAGEADDRFEMTLDDFGTATDIPEADLRQPSSVADSDTDGAADTITREGFAALFRNLPDEQTDPPPQREAAEQTLADLLRNPNASVPGGDRPAAPADFADAEGPDAESVQRDSDLDPFSQILESRDTDSPPGENTEKKN